MRTIEALAADGITARRYFHPSLDTLDYVDSTDLPVAHDVTRRVACLPLMYQLTAEDIERVTAIIQATLDQLAETSGVRSVWVGKAKSRPAALKRLRISRLMSLGLCAQWPSLVM